MLFDSENENAIMSTLDALGLDDPVQSSGITNNSNSSNNNNNSSSSSNNSTGMNGMMSSGINANHRVGVDLRSRSASFASSALSHMDLGSARGSSSTPTTSSPLAMGSINSRSSSMHSLNSPNSVNGISSMNGSVSSIKSNGSSGALGGGGTGGGNASAAVAMPDIRLEKSLAHSLLMPNSVSFANRIRSYSVSATAAYQEVLEDEHEDDIGHLTSSSPSSGTSGMYSGAGAGGVHQFQNFQQTHSRPRAISMGFLEIPQDIADEQRKFANAMPRSYSDMKARQTHQRTTSAGADMLCDMVNGVSIAVATDKNTATANTGTNAGAAIANGSANGSNTSNNNNNSSSGSSNNSAITHGHSHSLSLGYSSQLHSQQQLQQQQHTSQSQRPAHQHSNSYSGHSLSNGGELYQVRVLPRSFFVFSFLVHRLPLRLFIFVFIFSYAGRRWFFFGRE